MKKTIKLIVGIAFLASCFVATAGALNNNSVICALDNYFMTWTGKRMIQNGRSLHEYKCPAGHTKWVIQ